MNLKEKVLQHNKGDLYDAMQDDIIRETGLFERKVYKGNHEAKLRILWRVANGIPKSVAYKKEDIHKTTFYRWIRDDKQFAQDMSVCMATDTTLQALRNIDQAIHEGDVAASRGHLKDIGFYERIRNVDKSPVKLDVNNSDQVVETLNSVDTGEAILDQEGDPVLIEPGGDLDDIEQMMYELDRQEHEGKIS